MCGPAAVVFFLFSISWEDDGELRGKHHFCRSCASLAQRSTVDALLCRCCVLSPEIGRRARGETERGARVTSHTVHPIVCHGIESAACFLCLSVSVQLRGRVCRQNFNLSIFGTMRRRRVDCCTHRKRQRGRHATSCREWAPLASKNRSTCRLPPSPD